VTGYTVTDDQGMPHNYDDANYAAVDDNLVLAVTDVNGQTEAIYAPGAWHRVEGYPAGGTAAQ
jgi:hypothetical protein